MEGSAPALPAAQKPGYRRNRDEERYELSFSKAVHGLLMDSENRAGPAPHKSRTLARRPDARKP